MFHCSREATTRKRESIASNAKPHLLPVLESGEANSARVSMAEANGLPDGEFTPGSNSQEYRYSNPQQVLHIPRYRTPALISSVPQAVGVEAQSRAAW